MSGSYYFLKAPLFCAFLGKIKTDYPVSIYTFIPMSDNLHKFSAAFREIMGITWYRIRG